MSIRERASLVPFHLLLLYVVLCHSQLGLPQSSNSALGTGEVRQEAGGEPLVWWGLKTGLDPDTHLLQTG